MSGRSENGLGSTDLPKNRKYLKNYKKLLGEKIFFSSFQNFFYLFSDRPFSSEIRFHDFININNFFCKRIDNSENIFMNVFSHLDIF